jgi:hypothetical protein
MMNKKDSRLLTEFEQKETPYPDKLSIKFDRTFYGKTWKKYFKKGKDELLSWKKKRSGEWANCDILSVKQDENGIYLYTAAVFDEDDKDNNSPQLMRDVPREAFVFVDRPYTSDMALPNAFRHDIRIPDEIFPEAWKNKKE